jgi:hypothetical protein
MAQPDPDRAPDTARNRRLGLLLLAVGVLLFLFSFVYVAFLYHRS